MHILDFDICFSGTMFDAASSGQGRLKNVFCFSFALLISRYILQLGQAAQKQQRPLCPNRKMYLEIR